MDMPFAQAKLYLSKLTASHFNALNMKIAKGFSLPCSMRTRLFQMRISGIEVRNLYRPCTTGRLHLASWGRVTSKFSLVLVHFGLIKFKTKAKYNCISNILYLLSALACIPRVEAIWGLLHQRVFSMFTLLLSSIFV